MAMDTIYRSVAGLDLHKKTVFACVRWVNRQGKFEEETRTFGTMTKHLLELSDWLAERGVTHGAMEATGVYWKPVWNILDGRFELLLVNPRELKQVPGRKSDVKDCRWIAQLLQHGLLRSSFVPERPQRELRDLTRHRAQLQGERSRVANRIHKLLEDANIKLGSVASDILGVSAREMLQHLLSHLDHLDQQVAEFNARIEVAMVPFVDPELMEKLDAIPGVNQTTIENVIAEIGVDMNQFPTAGPLASWAGMCPGNEESAGKRKRTKTTKGNRWLRRALSEAAWAASHTKDTYLSAQYRRLAGRRGRKRALIAVGHTLLNIIYYVTQYRCDYQDLGADYFLRLEPERIKRYLVKRLEKLGYDVEIHPRHAA
jgi:transposase